MVEPQKVVRFLNETLFTRNKIIVINLELGYTGPIGLRHHDPKAFPDLAKAEEAEIVATFASGIREYSSV